MDFDFRAEYAQRSDDDLLAIVGAPHRYQPVAVSAAEAILLERGIDLTIAHATAEQSASGSAKTAFATRLIRKIEAKFQTNPAATVLDEPVVEPAGARRARWVFIAVLVLFGLHSIVLLLYVGIRVHWIVQSGYFEWYDAFAIATSIATAVGAYMLYQRERIGWGLLVAMYSLTPLFTVFQSLGFILKDTAEEATNLVLDNLISLTISGVALYMLHRREVKEQIGATREFIQRFWSWVVGGATIIAVVWAVI